MEKIKKDWENDAVYNKLYNDYQKALFNYMTVCKILDKNIQKLNVKRREYGLKDINVF